MLARLEQTLNVPHLAKQMMLIPTYGTASAPSLKEINLVVGYNGSPHSQIALDLTLWIAHQTRLATRKSVTVQVVYVIDLACAAATASQDWQLGKGSLDSSMSFLQPDQRSERPIYLWGEQLFEEQGIECSAQGNVAICSPIRLAVEQGLVNSVSQGYCAANRQLEQFEQADQILWQARNLADEWRGSLETHLRFGDVASELRDVACKEQATVLVLGCTSVYHPIVQALGVDLPFPVLGIPHPLYPV